MKVLLIDDDAASMQALIELLSKKRIKAVAPIRSIQEGIETVEAQADTVALAICNYRGGSPGLLKLFLQVSTTVPSIVFTDNQIKMENLSLIQRDSRLDFLDREDLPGFLALLDQFCKDGILESSMAPDSDFIQIPPSTINPSQPLPVDIYLRLAQNRYCRRFKEEDYVEAGELEKYCRRPGMEFLYVRKDELDGWMASQNLELDSMLSKLQPSQEEVQQAAQENLEIVHNVVSQIGFTPKAEDLAKKTVALTLKALGSSPQLSDILRKMQMQEGKYIASHSLMLAEISCALAHKMTWSSAPTFLKLTMASFLHDLTLKNNRLARMKKLDEILEINGFTPADAQLFKNHPITAAEYSRQLRQLPADVDTIVLQHHEQPDGSGFPRGLYHHQISPLACVFIVAQDLLDFYLANAGQNNADIFMAFLSERESLFSVGTFKKVLDSLKAPENPSP